MNWHQDDVTFETMREAEVWADSLSNEFYSRVINGYITPDNKIAYALSFYLASLDILIVHTQEILADNSYVYKVWVEEKE
ncbi:hypothetical protein [Aureibacillus halotolerans]|uniref:hypothetical protein n=1 Tax=Aureibacillus halotolerans TaxID=1508390 RepID=UPI00105DCD55|nr:hypothetical protein [Aureibacillus halotolerans]